MIKINPRTKEPGVNWLLPVDNEWTISYWEDDETLWVRHIPCYAENGDPYESFRGCRKCGKRQPAKLETLVKLLGLTP